jgi:hypothetical protein
LQNQLLAEGGTAIQTKMVREFQRAGARLVSELNVNFLKSSANFLCDATRPGAPESWIINKTLKRLFLAKVVRWKDRVFEMVDRTALARHCRQ